MSPKEIVKNTDFKEVAQVRVDSKLRISLGALSKDVSQFRVYRNTLGQIILDPQVSVPAYEAWLFQNPKALASVKKGLEQARTGKLRPAKDDFSKYAD